MVKGKVAHAKWAPLSVTVKGKRQSSPSMVMNYNSSYELYSRVGPVILCPAESAMHWVYCYLPMMLN